jgi:hypothetical protein
LSWTLWYVHMVRIISSSYGTHREGVSTATTLEQKKAKVVVNSEFASSVRLAKWLLCNGGGTFHVLPLLRPFLSLLWHQKIRGQCCDLRKKFSQSYLKNISDFDSNFVQQFTLKSLNVFAQMAKNIDGNIDSPDCPTSSD